MWHIFVSFGKIVEMCARTLLTGWHVVCASQWVRILRRWRVRLWRGSPRYLERRWIPRTWLWSSTRVEFRVLFPGTWCENTQYVNRTNNNVSLWQSALCVWAREGFERKIWWQSKILHEVRWISDICEEVRGVVRWGSGEDHRESEDAIQRGLNVWVRHHHNKEASHKASPRWPLCER